MELLQLYHIALISCLACRSAAIYHDPPACVCCQHFSVCVSLAACLVSKEATTVLSCRHCRRLMCMILCSALTPCVCCSTVAVSVVIGLQGCLVLSCRQRVRQPAEWHCLLQMNKQLCQYAAGYATQHISMRRLTDMFDFWQAGLARAC